MCTGEANYFIYYKRLRVIAKLATSYRFLSEKRYLDDPEPILQGLYAIEPEFIALVKQRS